MSSALGLVDQVAEKAAGLSAADTVAKRVLYEFWRKKVLDIFL